MALWVSSKRLKEADARKAIEVAEKVLNYVKRNL